MFVGFLFCKIEKWFVYVKSIKSIHTRENSKLKPMTSTVTKKKFLFFLNVCSMFGIYVRFDSVVSLFLQPLIYQSWIVSHMRLYRSKSKQPFNFNHLSCDVKSTQQKVRRTQTKRKNYSKHTRNLVHIWVEWKRIEQMRTYFFDWITLITRLHTTQYSPIHRQMFLFVCSFYWLKCLFRMLPAISLSHSLSLALARIHTIFSLTFSKLDTNSSVFILFISKINLLYTFSNFGFVLM